MTEAPKPYGSPVRGVTQADVSLAADALLRAGDRPTVERIRGAIGSGSPNTVGPLLDAWWKRLSARLDAGPAALHRLPESVAHVAEVLWMQALDEGRRRAQLELKSTQRSAAEQHQSLEVRSHVLTLREGELDARLRDRETTIADLNLQLRELTLLLRKEQATRDAQSKRISVLEEQLLAASSSGRAVRAFPALARQRRARGVTPARLPESRPGLLDSVAVSLPQGSLRKRGVRRNAPKTPTRPKPTARKPHQRAAQLRRPPTTKARKKSATRKRRR